MKVNDSLIEKLEALRDGDCSHAGGEIWALNKAIDIVRQHQGDQLDASSELCENNTLPHANDKTVVSIASEISGVKDEGKLMELVRKRITEYREENGKSGFCFSATEAGSLAVFALRPYLRATEPVSVKQVSKKANWLSSVVKEILDAAGVKYVE